MEISKKRAAEEIYCAIARGNCITILKTRQLLDREMIANTCQYVSSICKLVMDDKCQEQSKTCYEASLVLRSGDEKRYLKLCQKATETCPYTARATQLQKEFLEHITKQKKNEARKSRKKKLNYIG